MVLEAARLLHRADTEPDQKSQLAQQALILLDDAIALDPSNSRAWNIRGLAKHDLGDHEDAITDYNEAIRLNPTNDKAWNNRGMAKSDLGDHEGAISDLDEAIRLNPTYDKAWNTRGSAKYGLGDYQGAITDYDEAIRLNPKNDSAWSNRGLAKLNLGDYHGAIKDYDQALILNPDDANNKNGRLAAENALRTKEQSKKLVEEEENHYMDLLQKSGEHRDLARKHKKNYIGQLSLTPFITLFFIFIFYSNSLIDFDTYIKNPLTFLPFLTILIVFLTPLIWLIRINIRQENKHHALQEYYHSRYLIEFYMIRYFSEQTDRKRIAETYMYNWMVSPPSDLLIRLDQKNADHSDIPQLEILKELTRRVNTPPNT